MTKFEFRLPPVASVIGGLAMFEIARSTEVFAFFRDWVRSIPDELTPMLIFLEGPDADSIPQQLRGHPVIAIAACDTRELELAMEDLRPVEDLQPALFAFESMLYTAIQQMFDADLPAGDRYYFKGGFTASYTGTRHHSRSPVPAARAQARCGSSSAGSVQQA